MSGFVTYAQNFEDLMLWRALRDVKQGFYIDVGAADPQEDSVTLAFYERGWHGINVEPTPEHAEALSAARPRDLTLRCLAGAAPGEARLYHIADTGLSTMDKDFAQRHSAQGHAVETLQLPVRTLAEICARHAPAEIHFLKIDVEGAEAEVLRGADFATHRPWIVLLEATEPGTRKENWQGWEPLLLAADYRFAWFDGLNRFYLAAEKEAALRPAFQLPPNVFDAWVQPRGRAQRALLERGQALADAARAEGQALRAAAEEREALARREAAALRSESAAAGAALAAVQAEASTLRNALVQMQLEQARLQGDLRGVEHRRDAAEDLVRRLHASTSWRLTAPLRGAVHGLRSTGLTGLLLGDPGRVERLRRVAGTPGGMTPKGLARIGLYGLGRLGARLPGSRAADAVLRRCAPRLHGRLKLRYDAYHRSATQQPGSATSLSALQASRPGLDALSLEDQRMLLRLQAREIRQ